MPWSLNRFEPRNIELQGRYFSAVGKALAIANNFEHKVLHVLGVIYLNNAALEDITFEEMGEHYDRAMDKRLNNAIQQIATDEQVTPEQVETLHEGRRSRNFLAHEGPAIFNASSVSDEHIYKRTLILESHVRKIARADNLVSAWDYEIQEGDPVPGGFMSSYEERVIRWVFEELLEEARNHFKPPNEKSEAEDNEPDST